MRFRRFLLIATIVVALAGVSFFVLRHVQRSQPTPVNDHAQSFTFLQHPLVSVPSTGDPLIFTQVTVSGMIYQYEQQHAAANLQAKMPGHGLLTAASGQVHCPTSKAATDNTMVIVQQVYVCPSRDVLVVPGGKLQSQLQAGAITALAWLTYNVGAVQATLLGQAADKQQQFGACLAGALMNEVPLSPLQTNQFRAFFVTAGEQPAMDAGLKSGQIDSCNQL